LAVYSHAVHRYPFPARQARLRPLARFRSRRSACRDCEGDRADSRGRKAGCVMLNLEPNIASPDDFYQELIDLHRDLTDEQSATINAKLILLLANHIGDMEVLRTAMAAAREDVAATPTSTSLPEPR